MSEITGKAQNIKANSEGRLLVEESKKYLDVGLVVNGDAGGNGYQLAADAIAVVEAVDNVEWTKIINIFLKTTSAGPPELRITCINEAGVEADCTAGVSLWPSAGWTCKAYAHPGGMPSTMSPITGKRAKITIKNKGASAANFWMALQLIG